MDWNPYCHLFDIDDNRFIRAGGIYFDKSTFDCRLQTFKGWTISMRQKPKYLAKAGYFYTGRGDIIKYCHCAISLNKLQRTKYLNQLHAFRFDKWYFLNSDIDETEQLVCRICLIMLFLPSKRK